MMLKLPPEFRNGYKDRKRLGAVGQMKCIVCDNEGVPQKTRLEVHHFIGCGQGKKSSDLLTIPLCFLHHQKHKDSSDQELKALSIHGLTARFEKRFGTQLELLKLTNQKLGCEKQYKEYYKLIEINN